MATDGGSNGGVSSTGDAIGASLGETLRRRREARGLSLEDVQASLGGTPSPGFLARLEEGLVGPAAGLVVKLAAVLELPPDLLLNASGFATEAQRLAALVALDGSTDGQPGGADRRE